MPVFAHCPALVQARSRRFGLAVRGRSR